MDYVRNALQPTRCGADNRVKKYFPLTKVAEVLQTNGPHETLDMLRFIRFVENFMDIADRRISSTASHVWNALRAETAIPYPPWDILQLQSPKESKEETQAAIKRWYDHCIRTQPTIDQLELKHESRAAWKTCRGTAKLKQELEKMILVSVRTIEIRGHRIRNIGSHSDWKRTGLTQSILQWIEDTPDVLATVYMIRSFDVFASLFDHRRETITALVWNAYINPEKARLLTKLKRATARAISPIYREIAASWMQTLEARKKYLDELAESKQAFYADEANEVHENWAVCDFLMQG
jgi:hypothetical protein